jgi:nucleoside-diphosphate-sugar epimerase
MIPCTKQDARTLMSTFRGIARRVVAISSGDVYRAYDRFHGKYPGPPDPVPLMEEAPLRQRLYPYRGETPRSPDAPNRWVDDYDKILVEQVVMGNPDLPGTILRLPVVYGPGDRQHRLFPYLKRMDDGRPAILMDEGLAQGRCSRGYV